MNLDIIVRIGQPPWRPTSAASELDVWDKYDFPICGTFRVDGTLVIFTIITSVGTRSLWAYVGVPRDAERPVRDAQFGAPEEFDAFLKECFTEREAVFAEAEDLRVKSRSGGVVIPPGKNALLVAGTRWYVDQVAERAGQREPVVTIREEADEATLLRVAQHVLADIQA